MIFNFKIWIKITLIILLLLNQTNGSKQLKIKIQKSSNENNQSKNKIQKSSEANDQLKNEIQKTSNEKNQLKNEIQQKCSEIIEFYIHLIDYSIKEIVDRKGYFKNQTDYVYFNMLSISRYLEFMRVLKSDSEIVTTKLRGKKIFMPIFWGRKHAVVLYADTITKEAQFYDPDHEEDRWKSITAESKFKRFIKMLEKRNKLVLPIERIDTNDWKLVKPKVRQSRQEDLYNCAVYCIRWIDCTLNGTPVFGNIDTPIGKYRSYLSDIIKSSQSDPKLATQIAAQKKESYLYMPIP